MYEHIATDWESCARALGGALSRYNGLTNRPKLDLITEIVTGEDRIERDWFGEKPFVYAHEVIGEFKQHVGARSAEALLHHAIAFGFLYRAMPGGTMRDPSLVKRVEATSHIALTPLGRALRSSKGMSNEQCTAFVQFLWEYAVLECDFDLYGLLIKSAVNNDGKVLLQDVFYEAYYATRKKKYDWLMEKFPNIMWREQVGRNVQWIPRRDHAWRWGYDLPLFMGKTPGHHYNQRKSWANLFFHHVDRDGNMTPSGYAFAAILPPIDSIPFFWLAPHRDVAKSRFMRATGIVDAQCAPAWNLLRSKSEPVTETASVPERLFDDLARHVVGTFDLVRLHGFRQAPLGAMLPYLYHLEHELEVRVDEYDTFLELFSKQRGKLACELRKDLSRSHYWIRK